jgi:hypothetical protein
MTLLGKYMVGDDDEGIETLDMALFGSHGKEATYAWAASGGGWRLMTDAGTGCLGKMNCKWLSKRQIPRLLFCVMLVGGK